MKRPVAFLFGLLLVALGITFILAYQMYWARVVVPERSAMATAKPAAADKIDPRNENELVIVTGPLSGAENLTDPEFAIKTNALRLRRRVWMYQWQDMGVQSKSSYSTEDPNGNKTTYLKTESHNWVAVWSEKILRPRNGHNAGALVPVGPHVDVKVAGTGHDNPSQMAVPSRDVDATRITLGAFSIAPELVKQIDNFKAIPVGANNLTRRDATVFDNAIYIGANPNQPAIGDLKIRFESAPPATATVIAQQNGSNLAPYHISASANIATLKIGGSTATQMAAAYGKTESNQRMIVWAAAGVFIALGMLIVRPRRNLAKR